jgi:hypothetical protein
MALARLARAQRERGELQIEVKDPQGRSTAATGEIVSESNQVKRNLRLARTESTSRRSWRLASTA